jgi:hypothetical protein
MKNLLIFLLLLFLLLSANTLQAQKDTTIARNTLYFEGLGNAGLYSINYDRIFFIKKQKLSWRVGFSIIPPDMTPALFTFPLELNLLFGKKHHFEIGFGLSYIYEGTNLRPISVLIVGGLAGYRFQKPEGGLFFKAGVSTIFLHSIRDDSDFAPLFPNISIGYTFKNKKYEKNILH